MATYTVTWSMVYEDCRDEFDALAQANGSLAEVISNPSIGANFFLVENTETGKTTTTELHDGLVENDRRKDSWK